MAPLAGSSSAATGINDSSQVVGVYGTGSTTHPFLHSNGTMSGLPEPSFTGSSGCEAEAMNNTGQIAGECWDTSGTDQLVLWHNGAVTDLGTLGTPGTATFARAISINANGQIAGTLFTNSTTEGFLYSNGAVTNLGGSFLPAAINDNGVMIGGNQIDSGGTVQNLNNLIPAGSGYQIQNATGINDNGQIVANANDNNQIHALLLNPKLTQSQPGYTPTQQTLELAALESQALGQDWAINVFGMFDGNGHTGFETTNRIKYYNNGSSQTYVCGGGGSERDVQGSPVIYNDLS